MSPPSIRVDLTEAEWRTLKAETARRGSSPRQLATRLLRRELARLERSTK